MLGNYHEFSSNPPTTRHEPSLVPIKDLVSKATVLKTITDVTPNIILKIQAKIPLVISSEKYPYDCTSSFTLPSNSSRISPGMHP